MATVKNSREGIMKIVINAQFGGFSVSTKALKKLIEEGAEGVVQYQKGHWICTAMRKDENLNNTGGGYYVHHIHEDVLKKGEEVYSFNNTKNLNIRCDPVLIQIVEEMGDEASGLCATLEVVIADGHCICIEEYDGAESIE